MDLQKHSQDSYASADHKAGKKPKSSYGRRYRHYRVKLGYGIFMAFFAAITASCDYSANQDPSRTATIWLSPERAVPSQQVVNTAGESLSLAALGSADSQSSALPIYELAESKVCKGVDYRDTTGRVRQGSQTCTFSDCAANGIAGCKATVDFKATDIGAIDPRHMLAGYEIAGLKGNFDPSQYKDCSANGAKNCTSNATFKAIDSYALQPGNLRVGFTIAGVVTGKFPSQGYELEDTINGTTPLQPATFNWALRTKGQFHYWDAYGNLNILAGDGNLTPGNILEGQKIYGINGTTPTAKPPVCDAATSTNCEVASGWVGVDKAELKPELLKKGVTVGTIEGDYPSSTHRLTGHSSVTDLGSTFYDQLKSNDKFEYFDRNGERFEGVGDSELSAASLKLGQSILGVTGTFNGEDYDQIQPRDVRRGVTIKGTKVGTLDVTFVCETKAECLQHNWQDLTSTIDSGEAACTDSANHCLFRSKINDLQWAFEINGTQRPWADAAVYCRDLKLGGHHNWRMPTHKETLQATINGLSYLGIFDANHYKDRNPLKLWTATTHRTDEGSDLRLALLPENRLFDVNHAHLKADVICVRD